MAIEIVMPRLGWTMEEGMLAEWLKQDGDPVEVGDIIFTVESDKALNEVEALDSGILRIPPDSAPIGTVMPVGTVLAYLVSPGELAPFEMQPETSSQPKNLMAKVELQPTTVAQTQQATTDSTTHRRRRKSGPTISPRARRVALELGLDWTRLTGSGRTGRIVERDVRAAIQQPTTVEIRVSPVARRVAEELGVNLDELAAQVPGKRIERTDVEAAAASATTPTPVTQPVPATDQVIPLSHVRRIIATRMTTSVRTTAPVTLTTEADATELVRLRRQLKDDPTASSQPVPTYNDLLSKMVAQALIEHPALNARLEGEQLVISGSVHIGLAVDTERGLLVPVLRDVQSKSLRQITQESAVLIEQARAGQLSADELGGGTFTISNLGIYDIDTFTPIINLPECAILGVGRIVPKQVVVDASAERVAIRQMVFLSLTFDHRLVDGAPTARFLQRIKQFIEQPYLWLVS
jgi:pyruvate dehydrogenase E2 component (dihydrolipoamide acetyltransferase)